MPLFAVSSPTTLRQQGVTLTELLVTLAVITALCSIAIPAWGALATSRARQSSLALVMESLDRARSTAISTRQETWVVFRHGEGSPDALRLVTVADKSCSPLGGWQALPGGMRFVNGIGTLMEEEPPPAILKAARGGILPEGHGSTFGGVMFQRSGGIGVPLRGGNRLALRVGSPKDSKTTELLLSRATGRAACK